MDKQILEVTFRKEKTEILICDNCGESMKQLVRFSNKENTLRFCIKCLNSLTASVNAYKATLENIRNKIIRSKAEELKEID